jgi:hypothetical protein
MAANGEMLGGRPWMSMSRSTFFGSRLGSPTLLGLRAVVFVEFILAFMFSRRVPPDAPMLAFAAFMVVTLLGVIHVGLNTPVADS